MSVKGSNIRVDEIGTGTTINVPFNVDFQFAGQSQLIEDKFVEEEVDDAVNPIIDYERVAFSPRIHDSSDGSGKLILVNEIRYKLVLLDGSGNHTVDNYDDLGFDSNDLKFRRNSFVKSFTELLFYDSKVNTDQILSTFITLFNRLHLSDVHTVGSNNNLPKSLSSIPVQYKINNPKKRIGANNNPSSLSSVQFFEGYHIYDYKDQIDLNGQKELYMTATFNNAKNGESTNFMKKSGAFDINNLIDKLYTKYTLTKDANDNYIYIIDRSEPNVNLVDSNEGVVEITLYQVNAK